MDLLLPQVLLRVDSSVRKITAVTEQQATVTSWMKRWLRNVIE